MSTVQDSAQHIALVIIQSGVDLPPMPDVSAKLLSYSQQPEDAINVADFARLIETDPSLTTRILQLANSSYYSTLKKIVGLRQAIMHIGLRETVATVSFILCQDILPKFPDLEGFNNRDYWAHSWACATANRMLERPDLMVQTLPGELYLAGLLNGIGKLILAIHEPEIKEIQNTLVKKAASVTGQVTASHENAPAPAYPIAKPEEKTSSIVSAKQSLPVKMLSYLKSLVS